MALSPKAPLRDRLIRRLLRWSVDQQNSGGQFFTTLHQRPKQDAQIGTWPEPDCVTGGAAIVMQGPIATQDDFTLETLRLYRRHMPQTHLVLSTWDDTDPAHLAGIADLGVEIVLSEKPSVPGLFNINMQIVSASAGVRHAVDAGAEWIMKTRTDQRLYEPNVMPFLIGLAKSFPVTVPTPQKHRVIGIGHGSLKFAPYHVTDQTVFGHADDMLAYWTPPLQDSAYVARWAGDRASIYFGHSVGELCRFCAPESYFASQFLMRMGRALDWTVADSWATYRDHFCFPDYGASDFYWVKSQTYTGREHNTVYEKITNRQEMSFREWMLLYSGQLSLSAAAQYEPVLERQFNSEIVCPRYMDRS